MRGSLVFLIPTELPRMLDPLISLLLGMAIVVGGILALRLHAFLALLCGAVVVAVVAPQTSGSDSSVAARIADGFGNTCGKIGILIALAAIIGQALLDSGAAERIVGAIRHTLGDRRTPLALAVSGFVIGIPVYFDTVFYLLLPIARTLARQTRANYLLYILSIIVGGTMAHSLVPPTPGPLLVAAELNVPLGLMIVAGIAVGLVCAVSGYLYALWANRRWVVPLRDTDTDVTNKSVRFEQQADVRRLPPLWLALMPIALPVVLLSLATWLDMQGSANQADYEPTAFERVVLTLGDKHVALGLATCVALLTSWRYAAPTFDRGKSLAAAIQSAGSIVLITAAGGAFGQVLRESGIADSLAARFPATESGIGLILIAFFITALIRIAQGSATVAMITAVGIVGPLAQAAALPYHPVYVALAIGSGSKPLAWMNDSGFWVITRMSGMTEGESLRTFSVVLTIMGFVGLAATIVGASMWPGR
jgi:gluconate:H+ symporter, GntP family